MRSTPAVAEVPEPDGAAQADSAQPNAAIQLRRYVFLFNYISILGMKLRSINILRVGLAAGLATSQMFLPWTKAFATSNETASAQPSTSLWAAFNFGFPTATYVTPSQAYRGGYAIPISDNWEIGPCLAWVTAKRNDVVVFQQTGYEETRHYHVAAIEAGAHLAWKPNPTWRVFVSAGPSLIDSYLDSTATTAPLPSSLSPGRQKQVLDFGFDAGVSYDIALGPRFLLGVQLAYERTGVETSDALSDIFNWAASGPE
jgi:hypothetical protein